MLFFKLKSNEEEQKSSFQFNIPQRLFSKGPYTTVLIFKGPIFRGGYFQKVHIRQCLFSKDPYSIVLILKGSIFHGASFQKAHIPWWLFSKG